MVFFNPLGSLLFPFVLIPMRFVFALYVDNLDIIQYKVNHAEDGGG